MRKLILKCVAAAGLLAGTMVLASIHGRFQSDADLDALLGMSAAAQSVVIEAPKVLPDAAPGVRQRVDSAITAWALDLSAGHPTRYGTIDEFLNDSDFLVTITRVANGEILAEVHATPESAGSA